MVTDFPNSDYDLPRDSFAVHSGNNTYTYKRSVSKLTEKKETKTFSLYIFLIFVHLSFLKTTYHIKHNNTEIPLYGNTYLLYCLRGSKLQGDFTLKTNAKVRIYL